MMKLIGTATSPYTRKVRVVLAEKRMECEFAIDAPNTDGSTVAQFNPLGKIPVLVTDEGEGIFDSRVITQHLNRLSGGALYPGSWSEWCSDPSRPIATGDGD